MPGRNIPCRTVPETVQNGDEPDAVRLGRLEIRGGIPHHDRATLLCSQLLGAHADDPGLVQSPLGVHALNIDEIIREAEIIEHPLGEVPAFVGGHPEAEARGLQVLQETLDPGVYRGLVQIFLSVDGSERLRENLLLLLGVSAYPCDAGSYRGAYEGADGLIVDRRLADLLQGIPQGMYNPAAGIEDGAVDIEDDGLGIAGLYHRISTR